MSENTERLLRLTTLSQHVLDTHAAALARAQQKRRRLETALAALESPDHDVSIAAMQQRLRYEAWAAPRRAALHLAIQEAIRDQTAQRHKTQRAFVRVRLLEKIGAKARTDAQKDL